MGDQLRQSIDRLTAYVETHRTAKVDRITDKGGVQYGAPAPDRISGHADGTELLFSDLVNVLEVARRAADQRSILGYLTNNTQREVVTTRVAPGVWAMQDSGSAFGWESFLHLNENGMIATVSAPDPDTIIIAITDKGRAAL